MSLKTSKHPKVMLESKWHSKIKKDLKTRSQRRSRRITKMDLQKIA